MAHALNNRHTDNWWLETIASAITQDGSGNGTLNVTGGGTSYTAGATTTPAVGTATLARYMATLPTRTDGGLYELLIDIKNNLMVNMQSRLDPINDGVTAYVSGNSFQVISTATTTTIKTGAGVIRQIRVLGGTLGNISVYDNTAGSGTVIVPTVTPAGSTILAEDIAFTTGLTIVTAAASLILVSYR